MVKNVSKGSTSLYSWAEYESPIHLLLQFSSVAQSCLTLCDPRDCSTPGFPVHHQLPELAQTCFFTLIYLFIWLHRVLLVACAIYLPHQGSSPSTPCIGSTESQPLDYQGSHGLILTFYLANVVDRRVDPSYFTLYFCDYE